MTVQSVGIRGTCESMTHILSFHFLQLLLEANIRMQTQINKADIKNAHIMIYFYFTKNDSQQYHEINN